jgi:hypothetical protein
VKILSGFNEVKKLNIFHSSPRLPPLNNSFLGNKFGEVRKSKESISKRKMTTAEEEKNKT